MKLGLFTDLHYTKHPREGREYTACAPERVKEAMDAFMREKVDMVVCLGDFVDTCGDKKEDKARWKELMDIIHGYPIPYYMVPGNHDYENLIGNEFSEVSGMEAYPFYVDLCGRRSIFLDACYRSSGKRYDEAGMVWTDTILPDDQFVFLKNAIESSADPCIVFVHQNLDKKTNKEYRIKHEMKIRRLLKKTGKVKLVVNGHFHVLCDNIIGGVRYLTVPSMTDDAENKYVIMEV